MEKVLVKKSDVGQDSLFIKINDTGELIAKNYSYNKITEAIKTKVKSIYRNYLEIGSKLALAKKEKLYEINEYQNIYDYAAKEFELRKTSVKNLIAIANRFCDKDGSLLKAYKGFSYSNIVELLSVDEKDIKSFVPSMSVKAVRSKKVELQVNKELKALTNKTGSITQLIEHIKTFDWKKGLGFVNYEVTHELIKSKYKAKNEHSWLSGTYEVFINFLILRDKKKVDFTIKLKLHETEKSKYSLSSDKLYMWSECFKDFKQLDKLLSKIADKSKEKLNAPAKEKKESPGMSKLTYLGKNTSGTLQKIDLHIATNVHKEYYYESKGWKDDHVFLYAKPKKHKKTNPALFELKYLEDPLKAVVINLESKVETRLFPEFDKYISKALSKSIDVLNK
ncbi:hypothetical protein KQ51_01398 [Candidatus Izimaplasma bacterium HR1]|jgi:hypothetical protein|uniref:hypothetical protein n=1 Tax=Candidatus Izimoplasma sp. HR1 TaxID=1541959 RepID=UPI0004F793BF|nr:hypothetical protein KQ51_01398 [Candidatus Izimaplasma bacterium HR1]